MEEANRLQLLSAEMVAVYRKYNGAHPAMKAMMKIWDSIADRYGLLSGLSLKRKRRPSAGRSRRRVAWSSARGRESPVDGTQLRLLSSSWSIATAAMIMTPVTISWTGLGMS